MPSQAAANYLGLSIPTHHTHRWAGTGPVSRKIGRRVVYAQGDLDAWVAGRDPATFGQAGASSTGAIIPGAQPELDRSA